MIKSERVADGKYPFAHFQFVRVAEPDKRQILFGFDLYQCHIAFGIPADYSGFKFFKCGKRYIDLIGIFNNMVVGVVEGYSKQLIIKGVGFRATLQGDQLDLALGYSHPVVLTVPAGITVTVVEGTKLTVAGADKQVVGELAATIYSYFPAEPYKGKGVQIVGQYVRRKEGKKSA